MLEVVVVVVLLLLLQLWRGTTLGGAQMRSCTGTAERRSQPTYTDERRVGHGQPEDAGGASEGRGRQQCITSINGCKAA
jgi:hypothetical protein